MERIREERNSNNYWKFNFDKNETQEIPPLTYAPSGDPGDIKDKLEESQDNIEKALADNAKTMADVGHTAVAAETAAA